MKFNLHTHSLSRFGVFSNGLCFVFRSLKSGQKDSKVSQILKMILLEKSPQISGAKNKDIKLPNTIPEYMQLTRVGFPVPVESHLCGNLATIQSHYFPRA